MTRRSVILAAKTATAVAVFLALAGRQSYFGPQQPLLTWPVAIAGVMLAVGWLWLWRVSRE